MTIIAVRDLPCNRWTITKLHMSDPILRAYLVQQFLFMIQDRCNRAWRDIRHVTEEIWC